MNQEHFKSVIGEWYNPLYRFALSLCSDENNALDLTQNAFFKLAKKKDSLRDPTKAKSWLFSTLHREFVDQYRRNRRFPSQSIDSITEPQTPHGQFGQNRVDAQLLMSALAELDEKFRAPLSLFYLEHFSYKEIAEILDIPMGTVMSRLRRAKDHLRAAMTCGTKETAEPKAAIDFYKEANNG